MFIIICLATMGSKLRQSGRVPKHCQAARRLLVQPIQHRPRLGLEKRLNWQLRGTHLAGGWRPKRSAAGCMRSGPME